MLHCCLRCRFVHLIKQSTPRLPVWICHRGGGASKSWSMPSSGLFVSAATYRPRGMRFSQLTSCRRGRANIFRSCSGHPSSGEGLPDTGRDDGNKSRSARRSMTVFGFRRYSVSPGTCFCVQVGWNAMHCIPLEEELVSLRRGVARYRSASWPSQASRPDHGTVSCRPPSILARRSPLSVPNGPPDDDAYRSTKHDPSHTSAIGR